MLQISAILASFNNNHDNQEDNGHDHHQYHWEDNDNCCKVLLGVWKAINEGRQSWPG